MQLKMEVLYTACTGHAMITTKVVKVIIVIITTPFVVSPVARVLLLFVSDLH